LIMDGPEIDLILDGILFWNGYDCKAITRAD